MSGSTQAAEPKHIVWDWNGTLLADNHAVVAAVNAVCCEYGAAPIDLQRWRSVFGRPLTRAYERVLGRELVDHDWMTIDRVYHDKYRELMHTCGLVAGAQDTLRRWSRSGGSQSLLSMFFHDELVPLVRRFRLQSWFGRVDGLREGTAGDSKASHLARHLRELRTHPTDVVVVGDVADDAHAAEQAGANCVLVTTGVMARASLAETGHPVADSPAEAVDLIQAGVPSGHR